MSPLMQLLDAILGTLAVLVLPALIFVVLEVIDRRHAQQPSRSDVAVLVENHLLDHVLARLNKPDK